MIEKAEDGDGELLGHLMLTARKVAQEQGLEKVGWVENWAKKQEQLHSQHYMSTCMLCNYSHVSRDTEWLSTMEWRVASQCTICTSTSSEVASSTGPLAKADQFPGEVSFVGDNILQSADIPWF